MKKHVTQELYDTVLKLLESDDHKTRYGTMLMIWGFDDEMPDFIEPMKKCLEKEKIGVIRGMMKRFIEEAEQRELSVYED